ncbi:MAG: hypothetical protein BWZ10_00113 [candidate division BRC1 bacterium ADurb.BinA364]|nr:MAG: hypothetical protein BWZ10_00113 [candidate division BRC1 bacterium ADurb.BinA364]
MIDAVAQLAHLLHAVVRRAVDLDDIQIGARDDRTAIFANAARRGCRPVFAIDRLGQNPRRAGFADAARSGEQVGVRNALFFDALAQSLADLRLPDKVFEGLRAPLAREADVRRRRGAAGPIGVRGFRHGLSFANAFPR